MSAVLHSLVEVWGRNWVIFCSFQLLKVAFILWLVLLFHLQSHHWPLNISHTVSFWWLFYLQFPFLFFSVSIFKVGCICFLFFSWFSNYINYNKLANHFSERENSHIKVHLFKMELRISPLNLAPLQCFPSW